MGYNLVQLKTGQKCDYLALKKTEFQDLDTVSMSEEPVFGIDYYFVARFNDNLSAGDEQVTSSLKGCQIRRVSGSNINSEYVATIPQTPNANTFVIDYAATNNTDYTYYLFPQSIDGKVEYAPLVSEQITTDWSKWSLFVVDNTEEDNVYTLAETFIFELNITSGDIQNNTDVKVIKNFTAYPKIIASNSNYWSGSLSSLAGYMTSSTDEYVQTPDMTRALKSLTTDPRKKFLKDIEGNIFEIKVTGVGVKNHDNLTLQLKEKQIEWVETGDAQHISITNNPDASNHAWVLTEDGEALETVSYEWFNDAHWDMNMLWTQNKETDVAVLGRTINTKGE